RALDECEQRRFAPLAARDFGDDLLSEHIERVAFDLERIELAAAHRVEQRRAFGEIVARQRKEPRLRRAADGMPRTARTLQERRDRTRRRELADEVDVADVDAELERRRGHERPQLAALQALLGREALLAREAAVV